MGSKWEFDYRRNDKGIQLIHPFGDGQCILTIERNSISLTTPRRWIDIGYEQGNMGNLAYTAAFENIFPLDDISSYHVQTYVDGSGTVFVNVENMLVATGTLEVAHPIDFFISPVETFRASSTFAELKFSGDGFPVQWSKGLAGVILEPVDTGFNQVSQLTYSPGPPDMSTVVRKPVDFGPILWTVESGGNGHYYEYVSTGKPWPEARQDALARRGYLATITSPEENAFI